MKKKNYNENDERSKRKYIERILEEEEAEDEIRNYVPEEKLNEENTDSLPPLGRLG